MSLPSLFNSNRYSWNRDPFLRLNDLQREMDTLFRDFREPALPAAWTQAALPACDIHETDRNYELVMDMPGLRKEDIKVELKGNQLTVAGERKEEKREEKGKNNWRSERFYGAYARSFALPEGVKAEDIASEYKDGVLKILVPKAAQAATKQIRVG